MGNCLNGDHKQAPNQPQQRSPQHTAPAAKGAMSQPPSASSDVTPQMSKLSLAPVSASDTDAAPRPVDGPAPPLSDDAVASPASSLHSSVRRHAPPPVNANPQLTESALQELNSDGSARRGRPSSTGGTTANTRPTDAPDLPELSDVPEMSEVSGPPSAGANTLLTGADMPAGTPPPVADHLPVVSLQDIAVMEQKQGRRRGRVRSRRGSTTASHASLSAIPENLEITPLHARSERSDSMRVTLGAHPVTRLADVQELDIESKSNTAPGSRPSESPRSTSSLLTSGDDSVMPHAVEAHVEQQLEMLMPLLPTPRPYWRNPNATEAYRGLHRSPSGKSGGVPPGTSPLGAQVTTRSVVSQHSTAAAFAASPARPSQGGGSADRVVTDASGLVVLRSTVRGDISRVLEADQLDLSAAAPVDAATDLAPEDVPSFQQGLVQQETLRFALPEAVEGLRCVKKYTVGELSWDQTVLLGDLPAGEHEFTFEESTVPTGTLTRGRYCMKTVFMDAHGQYLWAGLNQFALVPAAGAPSAHAP